MSSTRDYRAARSDVGAKGLAFEFGVAPISQLRFVEQAEGPRESCWYFFGRAAREAHGDEVLRGGAKPWPWLSGPEEYAEGYDRRVLDIGGSVFLGYGVDVLFHPIETSFEILDFIAGFFLIDMAGDDEVWVGPLLFDTMPVEVEEPESGEDAP